MHLSKSKFKMPYGAVTNDSFYNKIPEVWGKFHELFLRYPRHAVTIHRYSKENEDPINVLPSFRILVYVRIILMLCIVLTSTDLW